MECAGGMINYNEAFNSAKLVPGAHKYISDWRNSSEEFRKTMLAQSKAEIDFSFSDNKDYKMDIFTPGPYAKASLVFLHGGFWTDYNKSYFSHLAMGPVLNDIRVVIPDLPKCPDFTIPEIGLEVVKCLKTVSRRFKGEIILVGHQSGGHLAAKMASKGVVSEEVLSKINRVMAISPITDLRPLIYTKRKDDLKLTEEIAQIESLVDLELAANTPVTIWVGADERSIYIDQAKQLASKWSCPWYESKGKHHFDIIDGLETKSSSLMNVLLSSLD